MMRLILFLSFFLTTSIMVSGQKSSPELFDKLVYISGKQSLPYRLLKPKNSTGTEKFPLVIFLHGAGERGNDNDAQILHIVDLFTNPQNRTKYPCYVLAPQCPKGEWWASHNKDGSMKKDPTPSMKLLIELIEKICRENSIDPTRVYITGVSMGGFGTWDLLARFPNRFAAAVPICGGGDEAIAPMIKHIPQWIFHGAKDNVVHPRQSRKMVKALQSAGGIPGYTEYPDVAHNSWVQAYQEPYLLPWLFRQKIELPNTP
jgi:predicted peptidase